MLCLVGLGNPGEEYRTTRHNAGFMVIDALAAKYHVELRPVKKLQAEVGQLREPSRQAVLAKPLTFINNSGASVQAILQYYKLPAGRLLLIHDDKDIALGSFRVQTARGAAGHNGVSSVIDYLGTNDFTRIRLGIAPEGKITDTAGFVLNRFTADQQAILDNVIANVIKEIEHRLAR